MTRASIKRPAVKVARVAPARGAQLIAGTRARLAWLLRAPMSALPGEDIGYQVADGRGGLRFVDNGADVLFVAHCDHYDSPVRWDDRHIVRSAALDDRLGVWALETAIAMGCKADLLLTDCEERGESTGEEFIAPRSYRLIVSADRRGAGSVLYQYEHNKAWERFCKQWMGPVEIGSYSCISTMDHVGACAINVGVGYQAENTSECWADLRVTRAQVARIVSFVARARRSRWPWDASMEPRRERWSVRGSSAWEDCWQTPAHPFTSLKSTSAVDEVLNARLDGTRREYKWYECAEGCPRCHGGGLCDCSIVILDAALAGGHVRAVAGEVLWCDAHDCEAGLIQ